MAFLGALFFGFVPMFLFAAFVNWLDRYEKEPKLLLGAAFVWGMVVAAGGAFIVNTLFGVVLYGLTGSQGAAEFGTTSIIAPIVEEALKGLAVLIIFLLFRNEFDSILDGIVYAAIAAMGFAAVENVLYIYRNGYLEGGWAGFWTLVIVRVLVVGPMHPFFTAFTGIGVAVARLSRSMLLKVIAIPAGYAVAVLAHAFHNTFSGLISGLIGGFEGFAAGTLVDFAGYAIMLTFIIWMIVSERNMLQRNLREEMVNGTISPRQYSTAASFFQTNAYLAALTSGTYRATSRFYQVCGELAHKKEQLAKVGDEDGNRAIIERLRAELAQLAPQARA